MRLQRRAKVWDIVDQQGLSHARNGKVSDDLINQVTKLQEIFKNILIELESMTRN